MQRAADYGNYAVLIGNVGERLEAVAGLVEELGQQARRGQADGAIGGTFANRTRIHHCHTRAEIGQMRGDDGPDIHGTDYENVMCRRHCG